MKKLINKIKCIKSLFDKVEGIGFLFDDMQERLKYLEGDFEDLQRKRILDSDPEDFVESYEYSCTIEDIQDDISDLQTSVGDLEDRIESLEDIISPEYVEGVDLMLDRLNRAVMLLAANTDNEDRVNKILAGGEDD